MVHAGLPPQWTLPQALECAQEVATWLRDPNQARQLLDHMYGDQPSQWSPSLNGFDRLRFIINALTRLRVCSLDGEIDAKYKGNLQHIPNGFLPWFRIPSRQSRGHSIVCGHWSALGLHAEDGVTALDTGCVWGQQLCAFRLDRQEPPIFVHSKQPAASHD